MERDADEAHRSERSAERLDRNWDDLLQELRVAQTGVQLLTGLLLTVPFQSRFRELVPQQLTVYLITVSLSVLATGLLVAPVVLHRMLFRQGARGMLVSVAQRFALAGFCTLAFAVVGVCTLIFDVVLGAEAGIVAGAAAFVTVVVLWGVVPMVLRGRIHDEGPTRADVEAVSGRARRLRRRITTRASRPATLSCPPSRPRLWAGRRAPVYAFGRL